MRGFFVNWVSQRRFAYRRSVRKTLQITFDKMHLKKLSSSLPPCGQDSLLLLEIPFSPNFGL
jgi:hypothetical protein